MKEEASSETRRPRLLIIDDDSEVRTQLRWGLKNGFEVQLAEDRESGLRAQADFKPDVAVLDLGLPPAPNGVEEGFRTLGALLDSDPVLKIVVVTGGDEKANALRAVERGAYDFFPKPIELDPLKVVLSRALYLRNIERENRQLRDSLGHDSFEGMFGTSPQIVESYTMIQKLAKADVSVLITGESGTGKEMTARAIHHLSSRVDGPFIAINCGAIPEQLLESELFGHEKGSFTGAHAQRTGLIESAHRGILFLDEIGELSPALQVKLLRFLQERQFQRVGGREPISVDVRVLTATNSDLTEAMNEGQFRKDLYYRIGVVVLPLPPLREREGDIALLSQIFLKRYAEHFGKRVTSFSNKALRLLETYPWPGNVRELENRIQRAVIMCEGSSIDPGDLQITEGQVDFEGSRGLKEAREEAERIMIKQALGKTKGNLTRAASLLKISRPTLYELMDKLGIKRK